MGAESSGLQYRFPPRETKLMDGITTTILLHREE